MMVSPSAPQFEDDLDYFDLTINNKSRSAGDEWRRFVNRVLL